MRLCYVHEPYPLATASFNSLCFPYSISFPTSCLLFILNFFVTNNLSSSNTAPPTHTQMNSLGREQPTKGDSLFQPPSIANSSSDRNNKAFENCKPGASKQLWLLPPAKTEGLHIEDYMFLPWSLWFMCWPLHSHHGCICAWSLLGSNYG